MAVLRRRRVGRIRGVRRGHMLILRGRWSGRIRRVRRRPIMRMHRVHWWLKVPPVLLVSICVVRTRVAVHDF